MRNVHRSQESQKKWCYAYLGIGTNIADREDNLTGILGELKACERVKITSVSKVYETLPWGFYDQDNFLNCVLKVSTILDPYELLEYVKEIERGLGRTQGIRWGPRIADIDILLYEDVYLDDEILTIPHKYMWERDFVLVPLADIYPKLIMPSGEELGDYVKNIVDKKNVVLFPFTLK